MGMNLRSRPPSVEARGSEGPAGMDAMAPQERTAAGSHRVGGSPSTAAGALAGSPRMVAQRQAIRTAFGSATQLREPEEELPPRAEPAAEPTHRPAAPPPNPTGMPDALKAGIESLSGMDMSQVRVHTNSPRPAQLQALAYAQGNDIHLGPGQEQHLPHEAWHVVQQRQGRVQATRQMAGMGVNDDVALEREADVMGSRAAMGPAPGKAREALAAGPAPAAAGDAVQRRIGFEIETGIPITEQIPNPDPVTAGATPLLHIDAHPQTMAQNVRRGSMVISADHYGAHAQTTAEPFDQWSIIEAVTDPINDSMSINQFDAVATAWLSRLIAIKQDAQATPPAHLLQGSYYTGLPSAQGYGAWDRIAPQVTVGVPLDQAGKLISSFNFRGGPAREYNATQLANAAPGKAMKVMQDLLAAVPPGGVHQDGVNELRGLVTLMMNYLTAGNDDQIAKVVYMKNRPSNVFYKSKLSDVRNNLLNFTYANQVLGHAPARSALRPYAIEPVPQMITTPGASPMPATRATSASFTTTPVALSSPSLAASTVNTTWVPTSGAGLSTTRYTFRSADWATAAAVVDSSDTGRMNGRRFIA